MPARTTDVRSIVLDYLSESPVSGLTVYEIADVLRLSTRDLKYLLSEAWHDGQVIEIRRPAWVRPTPRPDSEGDWYIRRWSIPPHPETCA
ncbi:hypothetical protein Afil01_61950 [Actinorhabdospora filicis]|uniref:Uncharacterized protein n=1 Tax=Actinorhabdospora filicis TaxID=1785913 RepID=A0A9W6SSR4_9ACTN|nr:hypothetical protein [Actinorhabdospora filicis]GLZ81388.1 hypothetical protein Afil01_61950 [Actinorhabdospora filicis]